MRLTRIYIDYAQPNKLTTMQTIEIKKTSDEAKKERTYPYMGIYIDGSVIVWFTKPKTGISIKGKHESLKLEITSNWYEEAFTPMQGDYTFTFKND